MRLNIEKKVEELNIQELKNLAKLKLLDVEHLACWIIQKTPEDIKKGKPINWNDSQFYYSKGILETYNLWDKTFDGKYEMAKTLERVKE